MSAPRKDWRKTVAEEMLRHIEAGTAPFQKPWNPGFLPKPHNPTSDKAYRGINALWLELQGREDPRWMTYRQASAVGAQVRSGEKAVTIEYWKWAEKKPVIGADGKRALDDAGAPIVETVALERPRVFYAAVFNAEQIDGLEPFQPPAPPFEPVATAEKLLKNAGVKIAHDQNDRAFYNPAADEIHLPPQAAFGDAYQFYALALHELGHATGHASRFNRDFGPFGSEVYAKEELRAELSSYITARELGLGHYPERHAAYCESWMKAIRDDPNFLFRAARDADRIAEWVMHPEMRQSLERTAQNRRKAMSAEKSSDLKPEVAPAKAAPEKSLPEKPRAWLYVPYAEKDEAKALGARWDRREKMWYAPAGTAIEDFRKWANKPQEPARAPAISPLEEFKQALEDHGVAIEGAPKMDGQWHRVPLADDAKGHRNGSYRAFLDGRPNGQIMNFKVGELVNWIARGESLSREDLTKHEAEAEKNREARRIKRAAIYKTVAKTAEKQWDAAKGGLVKASHPYLQKKDVSPWGVRLDDKGNLLVPLKDAAGRLWSIQSITPAGEKRFSKGGRKSGLMHVIDPYGKIGEKPSSPSSALGRGSVLIAEGFATAASLHEATGRPVVVAFDAGNLTPVAERVREKYPSAKIVVGADDDHRLEHKPAGNVGKIHAAKAAEKVGGTVVVPPFTDSEKKLGLSDWNDFLARHNSAEIVKTIRNQVHRRKTVAHERVAHVQKL